MVSVKTWPTGVLDMFESCEVFILLNRAMHALTVVLFAQASIVELLNLKRSEHNMDSSDGCLPAAFKRSQH